MKFSHLVSLLMGLFSELCRGEQRLQVVVQNGLLADAAQSEVLKKPGRGQTHTLRIRVSG